MNRFLSVGMLAGLLVLAGFPGGSTLAQEAADKLADIRAQQIELQKQIEAGELSHLTKRQQNTISRAQADVFAIIEGKQTLDELNISEKVRLENALESINANFVGTDAAGREQLVCKRVALTGTGMKTTRCAPQAEWDQVRETSRGSLEKQHVCTPPGCGQ